MAKDVLTIGGETIAPGETKKIELEMPPLYTATSMSIPVYVKRGKRPGPTMFVSAAIHGDELNGIEIVGRLIRSKAISRIRGTLIAVPMVNVYGVLNQSRYLPDRRDLNRSFPGSKKGSLAGRLANLFSKKWYLNVMWVLIYTPAPFTAATCLKCAQTSTMKTF